MKKVLIAILISIFSISIQANGGKGRQPCSGKKGGISHCEKGKFVCNDGSVSKSKKVCKMNEVESDEDEENEDVVTYEIIDGKKVKFVNGFRVFED